MKKTKNILTIFICVILIILALQSDIVASSSIDTNIVIGKTDAINSSVTITERFLGIFQVVGSIVSVAALSIIGIRYMFSTLEEKAKLKGVLIYYIIGAILVFATSNLLSIVYNWIWNL